MITWPGLISTVRGKWGNQIEWRVKLRHRLYLAGFEEDAVTACPAIYCTQNALIDDTRL